jgi:hypothetical protein
MSDVIQRSFWDGNPVSLGTAFDLLKHSGSHELRAVCLLQTHQLGFELRLEVNGVFSRSQVCPSTNEVLETSEHWRTVMIQAGWGATDSRQIHDTF